MHVKDIRLLEVCKSSKEYNKNDTNCGYINVHVYKRKYLLVLRKEKNTVASAADLCLMEKQDELEESNLPAIMFEYMHNMMNWRSSKHGIIMDNF